MSTEANALVSSNHTHRGSDDSEVSLTEYHDAVGEFCLDEPAQGSLNGHTVLLGGVSLHGDSESPIQRAQSASPRLESPRAPEDGQPEPLRALVRSVSQCTVRIPTRSLLFSLGAGALASIAVGTVGVLVAGDPTLIQTAMAVGGLITYGSVSFVTRWDIPHQVAATLTLPVATFTLFPVIGPVGVAAVALAAGAYGPELCTKIATAVGRVFLPEQRTAEKKSI
jgi:hypothetical protein